MSNPCKFKNDFDLDTCLYDLKNKVTLQQYNCTFAWFAKDHESSLNECTIFNITRKGGEHAFHQIAKGGMNNILYRNYNHCII